MKYDYLVVGSGLLWCNLCIMKQQKKEKKYLVVDKRSNIAGNIYTEEVEGINVHKYGAHIFHTNNKKGMEVCYISLRNSIDLQIHR